MPGMLTYNDVRRICSATRIVTRIRAQGGEIVFADDTIQLWVSGSPDALAPSAIAFIKAIAATSSAACIVNTHSRYSLTCFTLPDTDATRYAAYALLRFGGRVSGQLRHCVPLANLRAHLMRVSGIPNAFVQVVANKNLVMHIGFGNILRMYNANDNLPVPSRARNAFEQTATDMGFVHAAGPCMQMACTAMDVSECVTRVLARLCFQRVHVTVRFTQHVHFEATQLQAAADIHALLY